MFLRAGSGGGDSVGAMGGGIDGGANGGGPSGGGGDGDPECSEDSGDAGRGELLRGPEGDWDWDGDGNWGLAVPLLLTGPAGGGDDAPHSLAASAIGSYLRVHFSVSSPCSTTKCKL